MWFLNRNTTRTYCTLSSFRTSQPWLIIFRRRRRSLDFTTNGSTSQCPRRHPGSSYDATFSPFFCFVSGITEYIRQTQKKKTNSQLPPFPTIEAAPRSNLRLDHVLTPASIAPLLNNPAICAALFPHLPESAERTPEEIQAIVRTPQFSQALVSLSTALESGQLGPLLRQFGLGENAGAGKKASRMRG